MNKKNFTDDDDMLPEYELGQMRIIKRGPGHERPEVKLVRVTLEPDVALVFSDDQAVNEALRTLLRLSAAHGTINESSAG